MKRKNMSINIVLNGIRTILSLIFPLITFPYIARVLAPEGIGQANFASSIANYFVLIGALGITNYAIREGAKKCEDKEQLGIFASEMWSIGICASIAAYICLGITLLFYKELNDYRYLILIYSFQIFFNMLSMEWFLSIYEEYAYITMRSFVFQCISLLLLFLLVKKPEDVYWYVSIQMISIAGTGITNHIYVRKRVKLKLVWSKEILKHLPAIMLIFSTTLATAVYINLDTSMLGLIWGDVQVGYYSVAAKLYNIIKALINSMVTVYSVRLCSQYFQNREEYLETFAEAFQIITGLTIPIAMGGYLMREEIIIILGGEAYLEAKASLMLLLLSLIPATLGNLFGSGALLVIKEERNMFIATITGTIVNTVLNYIFIHKMKCTGAAAATLITELVVCGILIWRVFCYMKLKVSISHIFKSIAASVVFIPIVIEIGKLNLSFWVELIGEVFLCVLAYGAILVLLKDDMILRFIKRLKS